MRDSHNIAGHRLRAVHCIFTLWFAGVLHGPAAEPVPLIPESEIAALQQELGKRAAPGASRVSVRRDTKNLVRKANVLLEASPEASNRYAVLGILFQAQKKLVTVDNSERNRAALFATCDRLANAPDGYAEIRLEADLLRSEKVLSDKNAKLAERAEVLAEMVGRYRGTPAEAKSLLMGALIVSKLDAPGLEDEILNALDERFADDPEVIEFRRKYLRVSRLDVVFTGEFERVDGTSLRFPADIAGHLCLLVFWSKDKVGVDPYLAQVKAYETDYPGRFDVFSFNVDELPDAGTSKLKDLGLDWTVMRMPGGRKHQAYRTFAQGDPVTVVVNAYGHAVLRPGIGTDATFGMRGERGLGFKMDEARISEDRYLYQLQSLFIGDFLVGAAADSPGGASKDERAGIQQCFVPAPMRYRLKREAALEHYRKAAQLCSAVMEQDPAAADLWPVRNRRIIALLGLWNLATEPKYLQAAVKEAETALAADLPKGADVVPRFCLAKEALRRGNTDAESVLSGFVEATGGTDAPASALAAAGMLALDARSMEQHDTYRTMFLARADEDSSLWPYASFLRDRHHQYRLLKANFNRRERSSRAYIVNHGGTPMTRRLPPIELKTLDGKTLTLPQDKQDKLTYLVFVEPPPDPAADFPVLLDRKGQPTKNDRIRSVMGYATDLAAQHVNSDIDVVVAFLCDDAERVESLMKTNAWHGQAALVPRGLENPMVQQLGILSADRMPNVFLLRRDGTVAWWTSGLTYASEFGYPFAVLLAMKVHVEVCESEYAYTLLQKGEFQKAAQVFSGPFMPANPDRFGWLSPRYHGRAAAQMGAGAWTAALESIDRAIDAHKLHHFRGFGRRSKNPMDWRKDAARVTIKEPCDIFLQLWSAKAATLGKLGHQDEATALRKRLSEPVVPHRPDIYGLFHQRLSGMIKEYTQEKETKL